VLVLEAEALCDAVRDGVAGGVPGAAGGDTKEDAGSFVGDALGARLLVPVPEAVAVREPVEVLVLDAAAAAAAATEPLAAAGALLAWEHAALFSHNNAHLGRGHRSGLRQRHAHVGLAQDAVHSGSCGSRGGSYYGTGTRVRLKFDPALHASSRHMPSSLTFGESHVLRHLGVRHTVVQSGQVPTSQCSTGQRTSQSGLSQLTAQLTVDKGAAQVVEQEGTSHTGSPAHAITQAHELERLVEEELTTTA